MKFVIAPAARRRLAKIAKRPTVVASGSTPRFLIVTVGVLVLLFAVFLIRSIRQPQAGAALSSPPAKENSEPVPGPIVTASPAEPSPLLRLCFLGRPLKEPMGRPGGRGNGGGRSVSVLR